MSNPTLDSPTLVWVGSYGSRIEGREFACVRWTAEEAMQAMQDDWQKLSPKGSVAARLEFARNNMDYVDRELMGYAPKPHPRWEADVSYFAGGVFFSMFVYVEPFLILPSRSALKRYGKGWRGGAE